jgi:hypothetical protein
VDCLTYYRDKRVVGVFCAFFMRLTKTEDDGNYKNSVTAVWQTAALFHEK